MRKIIAFIMVFGIFTFTVNDVAAAASEGTLSEVEIIESMKVFTLNVDENVSLLDDERTATTDTSSNGTNSRAPGQDEYTIDLTNPVPQSGYTVNHETGEITFNRDAEGNVYTVTGESNFYRLVIEEGVSTEVILQDVQMSNLVSPILVENGHMTITLEGDNTVVCTSIAGGSAYTAGIFVSESSSLTIDGSGSLAVQGGNGGAGIGGSNSPQQTGAITIEDGTIHATGGTGAAGIGSASNETQSGISTITIDGGNVTATGGVDAAAIGTGRGSNGGEIIIDGGTIVANGNVGGAGIGSGKDGSIDTITIERGTVTAVAGHDAASGIGSGKNSPQPTVSISEGSNVFAFAGSDGLGISAVENNNEAHRPAYMVNAQIVNGDVTGDELFLNTANNQDRFSETIDVPTPIDGGEVESLAFTTDDFNGKINIQNVTRDADIISAESNSSPQAKKDFKVKELKYEGVPSAEDVVLSTNESEPISGEMAADDPNGDAMAFEVVNQPNNGALVANPNGEFTYTPDPGFSGTDSFKFKASDAKGSSNKATVTITVNPIDDVPVAEDLTFTTNEDASVEGNLKATDSEGDTLTYSVETEPANGTVKIDEVTGAFIYTPNKDFNGTDFFTYTANDGTSDSYVKTVTIEVSSGNDKPIAEALTFTVDEDTLLTGCFKGSDVDGDAITYSVVDAPKNGEVMLNGDGTFTYIPTAEFNGEDSFTYRAYDGSAQSEVVTVNVTVTKVNDVPVANLSSLTTDEDSELSGSLIATDLDNEDTLTYSLVDEPLNGIATVNEDGTYSYEPNQNFSGTDSFTYKVNDGTVDSNVSTVEVTVLPINDVPVVSDITVSGDEDAVISGTATAVDADGDMLTYTLIAQPANGVVEMSDDGTFTYTPNQNFTGTDTFTFKVNDGVVDSNIATVTIHVNGVNDVPEASSMTIALFEDDSVSGSLSAFDVDEDELTFTKITGPTHGTLSVDNAGNFTYTPDSNFYGTDSFTFIVSDGNETSNEATVNIHVDPKNDLPTASDDRFSTDEGLEITGNVASNDSDIESDTLFFNISTLPAHGELTLATDGTFTYAPEAEFVGEDTFTYSVMDSDGATAFGSATITVNPVNDAPISENCSFTTSEEMQVARQLQSTDVDSEAVTYTIVDEAVNGTATIHQDGTFTYVPNEDFVGTDSFTYKTNDGSLNSNVATVNIEVLNVNDTPVASDSDETVDEDVALSGNVTATDVDSTDLLTYSVVGDVANGELIFNADGTYTYTPDRDFVGVDSFTYKTNDGTSDSNVATVTFAVSPENDSPVAYSETYETTGDGSVEDSLVARDSDSQTLVYRVIGAPSDGEVTVNSDGTFVYIPDTGFSGVDSFTYVAFDGTSDSNIATANINVGTENDAPVAEGAMYDVSEEGAITGSLTATDFENDTLTFTIDDAKITPEMGEITSFNPNTGAFTFVAAPDYNGVVSFNFTVTDGTSVSNVATVVMNVTEGNDVPVATDLTIAVQEDTQINGSVSATDMDGDLLNYQLVADPQNGTLTFNANGTFTYIPNTDSVQSDSFTYVAKDGTTDSNVATVTIDVEEVNDAPISNDTDFTMNEDTDLTGESVTVNDVDGDQLTFILVEDVKNGTLTLNDDGSFAYVPNAGFNGTDYFTFVANDGTADSEAATVTINVNGENDVPTAGGDHFTIEEDTTINGTVATNDTDADGDTLTFTETSKPTSGTLTMNIDGTFTYIPNQHFNGTDQFTYTVSDGKGGSASGSVVITISEENDIPELSDSRFTTQEDDVLNGSIFAYDAENDSLTYALVDDVNYGSLVFNADGTFTYTPNSNFTGTDTFTVTAFDGKSHSREATVTIEVLSENDVPTVDSFDIVVDEDTLSTGAIVGHDIENDTLTYKVVEDTSNGVLQLNSDGNFVYTPHANFNGTDSFTYVANDGTGNSEIATVSITVNSNNDNPVADCSTVTIDEDMAEPFSGTVTASDIDGDELTFTLVESTKNGTLTFNEYGTYSYVPNVNFSGTDYFTFIVKDGKVNSAPATVQISVNETNDVPTTHDSTFETVEDVAVSGTVIAEDSDDETLIYSITNQPENGTVTLNQDGTFEYIPNANFSGTDFFTYTVSDSESTSNASSVEIHVGQENDAPVADALDFTVNEDEVLSGTVTGTDIDNDELEFVVVDSTDNGSLSMDSTGFFNYVPNKDFTGTDCFTFIVSDGAQESVATTVKITVNPLEDIPVAVGASFTASEGSGVSGNVQAYDGDADVLRYAVETEPSNGTVNLEQDGTFTYTPNPGFIGTDSFTFTASDGKTTSVSAKVLINVTKVNTAPVAGNLTGEIPEDVTFVGKLEGSDPHNDELTFSIDATDVPPEAGTVTLTNPSTGEFTYTPAENFDGQVIFTYTVSDGEFTSPEGTVAIDVTPRNDAPVAVDDTYTVVEDETLYGTAASGDVDPDGEDLIFSIEQGPTHGTVVMNSDGSFVYTPNTDFNGVDSFTYSVQGSASSTGNVDQGKVSIIVQPDANTPTAIGDSYGVVEDGSVSGNVSTNDIDPLAAANGLTYSADAISTSGGTVAMNEDGSFEYQPPANFTGTDMFMYEAIDVDGNINSAVVVVEVTPVNDAPIATDDSFNTTEAFTSSVAANDTDADGDALTYSIATEPVNGTVKLSEDGSFIYEGDLGFTGTDSFTYTVTDGTVSDIGTVTIQVVPFVDIGDPEAEQPVDPDYGVEVPPEVNNDLPPYVDNGLPPYVDNELPPYVDNGLPPYVDNELPPYVDNGLPPYVDNELPPYVDNGLPPYVDNELPPYVDNGLPPYVDNGLPPYVDNELPPYVDNGLPPYVDNGLPPYVDNELPPYVDNGLPPYVDNELPPYVDNGLPPYVDNELPPYVDNGLPPYVDNGLPPYIDNGLPPYVDNSLPETDEDRANSGDNEEELTDGIEASNPEAGQDTTLLIWLMLIMIAIAALIYIKKTSKK